MIKNITTITLLIFLASCHGINEKLEIGNDLFSKTFSFSPGKASRIEVKVRSNSLDRILSASTDAPYFEFVVNNRSVSSNHKLWVYQKHTQRSMGNGGTEHTIVFEGIKKPVRGLKVVLKQQTFPGSTILREKLELQSASESFQLNKVDGRLHFRFPAYAIDKSANQAARLTYASYPHNLTGNMTYNVHNSLLAGRGFWGNLQLMKPEERKWIGSQVKNAKKVSPYLVDVNPVVTGEVGDSPEIYEIVNREEATGQIILFSEEPFSKELFAEVNPANFLAARNHPYLMENGQINLSFQADEKEYSAAVIILPNDESGISIVSSTSQIMDAECTSSRLEYRVESPSKQMVYWDKKNGKHGFFDCTGASIEVSEKEDRYEISIDVKKTQGRVVLTKVKSLTGSSKQHKNKERR